MLKKYLIKNRTAQLIFQSFYCAFALIGFSDSIGLFSMKFSSDFYIHFTNISNYLCGIVMLIELIYTAKKSKNTYVKSVPCLKFISLLGIILTFLVFNLLLANRPTRNPILNFTPKSILYHIVLPLMYLVDWLLFYEHGKVKWSWLLFSAFYPLSYLVFVFTHAYFLHFNVNIMNSTGTEPLIYPYFFLNPERVGVDGVIRWFFILLFAFVAGSFIFLLIDRWLNKFNLSNKNHA